MMDEDGRKAAIAAYRERKAIGGVYCVRCETSGEVWVGHWPDLETIRTRLWFSCRHGAGTNRGLLAAWRTYGEAQFRFEVLERVGVDDPAYGCRETLKKRAADWQNRLAARRI